MRPQLPHILRTETPDPLAALQQEALSHVTPRLKNKAEVRGSAIFDPWNEVAAFYGSTSEPSELDAFVQQLNGVSLGVCAKAYFEFGNAPGVGPLLANHCADQLSALGGQLAQSFRARKRPDHTYEDMYHAPGVILQGLVQAGRPAAALHAAEDFRHNPQYSEDPVQARAYALRDLSRYIDPSHPESLPVMRRMVEYGIEYDRTFDDRTKGPGRTRVYTENMRRPNRELLATLASKVYPCNPQEITSLYMDNGYALALAAGIQDADRIPPSPVIDSAIAELAEHGGTLQQVEALVRTALLVGSISLKTKVMMAARRKTTRGAIFMRIVHEQQTRLAAQQRNTEQHSTSVDIQPFTALPHNDKQWPEHFSRTINHLLRYSNNLPQDAIYDLVEACRRIRTANQSAKERPHSTHLFAPFANIFTTLVDRRAYASGAFILGTIYQEYARELSDPENYRTLMETIGASVSRLAAAYGEWHEALHGQHVLSPRMLTDNSNLMVAYGIHHQRWQARAIPANR